MYCTLIQEIRDQVVKLTKSEASPFVSIMAVPRHIYFYICTLASALRMARNKKRKNSFTKEKAFIP